MLSECQAEGQTALGCSRIAKDVRVDFCLVGKAEDTRWCQPTSEDANSFPHSMAGIAAAMNEWEWTPRPLRGWGMILRNFQFSCLVL